MYERQESEYFTAKRKAARQLGVEYRYRPKDLPSNREIRDQIQLLANLHEGDKRIENLKMMRIDALRMMRRLSLFYPKLIGSVLTGHIRKGSDIDLHVFTDHPSAITTVLEEDQFAFQVERKRVIKQNEERIFTHILRELDRRGRRRGADVCTVVEAVEYVRSLESEPYL